MKITLFVTGKTNEVYLRQGVETYQRRISNYINFEIIEHSQARKIKNLPPIQQKQKEAEAMLTLMTKADFCILLDEKGTSYSSVEFSEFLQQRMNQSVKNLLFLVGGPWGFDEAVKTKAHLKLSLSKMTFSHQMVRLFFLEQLYRAFTIIKGEPYHND